jgi:single-stranded-DNA-specific exonuclease
MSVHDRQWLIGKPPHDVMGALTAAGTPALLAAILASRGIRMDELGRDPVGLGDPFCLPDMEPAVEAVARAIRENQKIVVYGDYDADGVTATCVMMRCLKALGGVCGYYIPNRLSEGYGLHREAIQNIHDGGAQLILTVDTGVSNREEAAYAQELGLTLVITDHHACPKELPDAAAIVNPKRLAGRAALGAPPVFTGLAGVGVAFQFCVALGSRVAGCSLDRARAAVLNRCADIVMVGTVADVVPLLGENRILVAAGLDMTRRRPSPGLAALMQITGKQPHGMTAADAAYLLAPRINAAGRMGSAVLAAELLLEDDYSRASEMTAALCRLNDERKEAERAMQRTIQVEGTPPRLLILTGEGWHAGVAGIVAARLSEEHRRSVVLICIEDGMGRGTARGLPGIRLSELLARCAPLLLTFGGHDLAAGFSVEAEKIGALDTALREAYDDMVPEDPLPPALEIDAEVPAELLTIDQVRALDALEPTGQGNAKPVLMLRGAKIESLQAIGKDGGHTRIAVSQGAAVLGGVWFGVKPDEIKVKPGGRSDVAFTPEINEFRGKAEVQLKVCGIRG